MSEDISAAEAARLWLAVLKWGLAIIALGLIFTFVMWRAGWWFTEQNTERDAHNRESSYGRQESLRTEVGKNIGVVLDLDTQLAQLNDQPQDVRDPLVAQRLNVVSMVCRDAAKIDDESSLDPAQLDFIKDNCVGGAVSPSSTYHK